MSALKMPPGIDALPRHAKKLRQIADAAARDDEVLALLVSGSVAAGTADELSDIDLKVVVDRPRESQVVDRLIAAVGRPVADFTGEHVSEPRLRIVLYDDLLHVDFIALSSDDLDDELFDPWHVMWERETGVVTAISPKPRDLDLQWVEERLWTWVWYVHSKILRGELYEALDGIQFLRSTVLFPLVAVTRGRPPAGSRRVEMLIGDLADDFEATVTEPRPRALMAALQASERLYRRLADPLLAARAVPPATGARDVVRRALEQGLDWQPPAPSE